ncbi:dihydrofolate reductase family protein [Thiohalobacter sp. IOR34]|uniref:RibD family protein n=1 Tax=Thiohalobacter sp. IOR34 TaxID=3057176 RepID=UPI0025B1AA53|nr:dihydrofolate reductase family protein [Thiohalobacter sp. IOR34]WJW76018.1 dihydrofolate reductase family protein [Thiohalobacter sp. IOR34]
MSASIQQLYPHRASPDVELHGLYLDEGLHRAGSAGRPLVYSNFITSLDGRIALGAPHRATHQVPPALTNPRDWRLYQELGAQADLLITSARYFRQYAAGEAQDTLPVGPEPAFDDLRSWRQAEGLAAQPDIAILSASLDIPQAALAAYLGQGRRIHLLTGEDAEPGRVEALRSAGVAVHFAGSGHSADGRQAVDCLARLGYRSLYVIAGPSVLYTLLRAGSLHRLYLTHAQRILGGEDFDTFVWGSELLPPQDLRLRSLYLDPQAPAGAGQLFASYDCLPRET